jgi:hypothetical protein
MRLATGRLKAPFIPPSSTTVRPLMSDLPPVKSGFVRLGVRWRSGTTLTPGDLVTAAGVDLDQIGPIVVLDTEAYIEIGNEVARTARFNLDRLGQTRIMQFNWRWLKLSIGRNHGLTIGQLRKLMQKVDASPLGRLHVNNTHTLIGLQDFKLPHVMAKLLTTRLNGYAVRPEALEEGAGPGNPAFVPGA